MSKPLPFVLVHGAWHGAWSYEPVIPLLAAQGHLSVARDLPAHGLHARSPDSFLRRPLDLAAFATEPSKVAGTTLDDYIRVVEEAITFAAPQADDQVVLVGHSMGGVPITAVAERMPEKVAHLVYLTAFMPASGVPGAAYITAEENAGEMVGPQLMADPAVIGALRMDPRSEDPSYIARGKQAFYGDLSDAEYAAVAHLLTPDVPIAPFATPVTTTPERWGRVRRHYIHCTQDQAIRPSLQERFVREANAFVPDRPTVIHTLHSSHSPFLSQPQTLARLLVQIARSGSVEN
jgi:pimeloyl-ACP methyl ester carboxylesterase